MNTFSILLLAAMLAIVVKKSDEEYLLVEIDNEEAKGMFLLFLFHRCTRLICETAQKLLLLFLYA